MSARLERISNCPIHQHASQACALPPRTTRASVCRRDWIAPVLRHTWLSFAGWVHSSFVSHNSSRKQCDLPGRGFFGSAVFKTGPMTCGPKVTCAIGAPPLSPPCKPPWKVADNARTSRVMYSSTRRRQQKQATEQTDRPQSTAGVLWHFHTTANFSSRPVDLNSTNAGRKTPVPSTWQSRTALNNTTPSPPCCTSGLSRRSNLNRQSMSALKRDVLTQPESFRRTTVAYQNLSRRFAAASQFAQTPGSFRRRLAQM